ncbi:hypothetical protein RSAG8_04175, partial [Rhizoctonia solani AG-8 WAC10335]
MSTLTPGELEVYQACSEAEDRMLRQKELEKTITIKGADMAAAVNGLLKKSLLKIMKDSKGVLSYKAVEKADAKVVGLMDADESIVYKKIQEAKNEGIWTKHLKSTELHQSIITRALKSLEKKGLVKSIKSVKHPTRKIYILANLQPEKEKSSSREKGKKRPRDDSDSDSDNNSSDNSDATAARKKKRRKGADSDSAKSDSDPSSDEEDAHVIKRKKAKSRSKSKSKSKSRRASSNSESSESDSGTSWRRTPEHHHNYSAIIQRVEKILRHEVHRGVVPLSTITTSWPIDNSITIPFTEILLGRPHAALGFSFTIPRKMVITETNNFDGAPRGLCSFERCPPPSFRESEGSVEWVAEAIMTLAGGGFPRIDERMLHVSTSNVAITRLVFPVLPVGLDVGALRDEPFFGDDLGVDLLGSLSRAVRSDYAFTEGTELSNLAKFHWDCYSRVLNLSHGHLVESQVYIPSGAIISQDSASFTMRLSLKLRDTPSRNQLFGKFRKSRPVVAKRLRIRLQRSLSTRGGQEIKPRISIPRISIVLAREFHLDLDGPESRAESRGALPSESGVDLLNITVPFDLQTDGRFSKETTQPMMPVSALVPSFRTPNIQLEYILTISAFFVGDSREYEAARFPLQIKPDNATRMDGPRDNPDSKLSLP